jgi:hypothetical protein
MIKWLRKSRDQVVEFCDRCARVCDAGRRAAAAREQAVLQALRFAGRV